MNWQTLLNTTPNVTSLKMVEDASSITLFPLTSLKVIRVEGDDATTFLHSLFTNDVQSLAPLTGQLTGFCSPKGRLLALFYLIKREKDILLILPEEIMASTLQRLSMFKLRSKVSLTCADDLVVSGCYSSTPLFENGTSIWQALEKENHLLIRFPGRDFRYLVVSDSSEDVIETESIGNAELWTQLDIESGLPLIYLNSKEQFTPQQINLDMIGGVSFKKGCYPGQEVVARLHYLGTPKRRMFKAVIDTTTPPLPNTEVNNSNGEVIGHVVLATAGKTDSPVLLSMKLADVKQTALINGQTVIHLSPLVEEA